MAIRFVVIKPKPMERIETTYGNFTVYLNRIDAPPRNLYHISFVDNRNKVHVAVLKKSINRWSFENSEKLPDWIFNLQPQFEMMIAKKLLTTYQAA
jgi:hypothetical protein